MASGTPENPYLLLAVFAISALMMGLVPILLARLWTRWHRTARPDPVKHAVYECGLETAPYQWLPLKIEYYIYGIIFLVFDVEVSGPDRRHAREPSRSADHVAGLTAGSMSWGATATVSEAFSNERIWSSVTSESVTRVAPAGIGAHA